jgi:hypothetical protein
VLATTSGDGGIGYTVESAGTTGCSVNATSGVLTYSAAGSCVVRATAVQTTRFSAATADVTFVVSGTRTCEDGGTCQIGDRGPGGGTVFYISNVDLNVGTLTYNGISSGGKYLEVANAETGQFSWCNSISGTANTSQSIGMGLSNTNFMRSFCNYPTNGELLGGGTKCPVSRSINGSCADWFLPSIGEVQAQYSNLYNRTPRLGTWVGLIFWSSSDSGTNALYQRFTQSSSQVCKKSCGALHRPIRAFNPIP